MISEILLVMVGSVLLLTGGIKVLYSRPFIVHVRHLGILPRFLNEIGASVFIQLECGAGAALILSAFSEDLVPLLMGLILFLSVLTAWGVKTGRVEDCGCYGGWLSLSLSQSLGLNCLYLIMLTVAWLFLEPQPPVAMWKVLAIIGVLALSNFMVRRSANGPLIDLSPLRLDRRWNSKWVNLEDIPLSDRQSVLFVFMSQRCYRCREWDPYILNLMAQAHLPYPVLILPESEDELEQRLAGVSHYSIKPGVFRYLVYQTPTAVLVTGGMIKGRWVTRFPEAFV